MGLDRGDILGQETDGAQDSLLRLFGLVLDLVLELGDLTLDDGATTGRGVRSQPQDVASVLEKLIDLLEPDMVLHDGAELFESGLLHDGGDARERLAHDGDKQVHEDQLHNDGGHDEHKPHHCCVLLRVVVLVEVT